ncbi:MAG: CoA transferase [Betaproteobacteria bacterium]|jgi:crotonobetainyl-CoA:carnitine CoA-transferase CaiB-like acyl-CoA transferase|nr:CoA transferase [Betaproteobacteria bacterium]
MGALDGIKVIDLTSALAGPLCTMMLGDAGAEVIKVEPPGGDAARGWGPPFWGDQGAEFLAINRNKRSIVLDLKQSEAREALFDLCRSADVFVENYRRGVPERLGIDYESLRQINPRLVYCSISGFGDSGPRQFQPAYDSVMQAFVGIMHMTGAPGTPPTRTSVSVCDVGAGMYANQAILLGLAARERTGKGQRVEASLFESQIAWMLFRAVGYFATGKVPAGKMGSASAHVVPYQAYPTADGDIMVGVLNDGLYRKLVTAMGLAELGEHPDYVTNAQRVKNRAALNAKLEARFSEKGKAEWEKIISAAGVPCSPINTIEDALLDPQTAARDMIMELDHPTLGGIKVPGIPIKMSETPGSGRLAPPLLGQHQEEVLREIGWSSERIAALGDGARRD